MDFASLKIPFISLLIIDTIQIGRLLPEDAPLHLLTQKDILFS